MPTHRCICNTIVHTAMPVRYWIGRINGMMLAFDAGVAYDGMRRHGHVNRMDRRESNISTDRGAY